MTTPTRFAHMLGDWSQREGPLYQRLADAIRRAIEQSELTTGALLPAQRVLAARLDVSRTTVVMAYDVLVRDGWLESRKGSGTRVLRAPAGALAPREGAAAVLSGRNLVFRGLVEKSRAEIEFYGAHLDGMPEVFEQALAEARPEIRALLRGHGYLPLGLPNLRDAIAARFERAGLATRREQVLVTSGAQQAIALIANLLIEPGDPVALEDPTYLGAIDAFTSFGARLHGVPLGPKGLAIDALRETVARTAPRLIYLVPTCHNPTGGIMDETTRREVAKLGAESGGVVVEDHTLGDLAFDRRTPPHIAAFAGAGTVLTVGSLSKLFWGGLRVGWIRGPEPAIARLSRLKVVSDLSGSLVSQAVGVHVLARAEELAEERRHEVRERLSHMMSLMAKHLPKWTYARPAGGLSLWVRIPSGDAAELAAVALRHGVAIVPGTVNSPAGRWRDHVRLPFVAAPDTLEDGISKLAKAWDDYAAGGRSDRSAAGVLV